VDNPKTVPFTQVSRLCQHNADIRYINTGFSQPDPLSRYLYAKRTHNYLNAIIISLSPSLTSYESDISHCFPLLPPREMSARSEILDKRFPSTSRSSHVSLTL